MKNRLIAIVLVFALIFNIFGHFFIFHSIRYTIKKEIKRQIKNGIPESQLLIFEFNTADLNQDKAGYTWYDKGKEFRYQGVMYDIVRIKVVGNKSLCSCFRDDDDTKVFSDLDKLTNSRSKEDKNCQSKSQSMHRLLITECVIKKMSFPPVTSSTQTLNKHYSYSIHEFVRDVPTPPPRKTIYC